MLVIGQRFSEDSSIGNSKNARHFVEILSHLTLDLKDRTNSLNVESLFSNVPTQAALDITKKKLWDNEELHESTSLPINAIMEILDATSSIDAPFIKRRLLLNRFCSQEFHHLLLW